VHKVNSSYKTKLTALIIFAACMSLVVFYYTRTSSPVHLLVGFSFSLVVTALYYFRPKDGEQYAARASLENMEENPGLMKWYESPVLFLSILMLIIVIGYNILVQ